MLMDLTKKMCQIGTLCFNKEYEQQSILTTDFIGYTKNLVKLLFDFELEFAVIILCDKGDSKLTP